MAAACPNEEMPHKGPQWYALQVQSKLAKISAVALSGKGYEVFLPVYTSPRRWSDRIKQKDVPLFPGYLFCQFDVSGRLLPVLTTPGVIGIVGVGKTPAPIREEELDGIRAVLRSGLAVHSRSYLPVGAPVRIDRGPLTGVEGIITNSGNACRLVVSITLLQRSVAVEIDRASVQPLVKHANDS
jgi:transcription antitermination factor NusG